MRTLQFPDAPIGFLQMGTHNTTNDESMEYVAQGTITVPDNRRMTLCVKPMYGVAWYDQPDADTILPYLRYLHSDDLWGLELNAPDIAIDDGHLTHFRHLEELCSLRLWQENVTAQGLRTLDSLKSLCYLDIAHSQFNSKDFDALLAFQQLHTLSLLISKNPPVEWNALQHMPQLIDLSVAGTPLSGNALSTLEQMHSLQTLSISQDSATDSALRFLRSLHELKSLTVWNGIFNVQDNDVIGSITHLQTLELWDMYFPPSFLAEMVKSPRLTNLMIYNNLCSDSHGYQVPYLPLRSLTLNGTNVSVRTLSSIAHISTLDSLILEDCPLTEGQCVSLHQLKELTSLSLANTQVGDVDVQNISKLPRLQSLILTNTNISDRCLVALSDLAHLVCLDLRGTHIKGTTFRSLEELPLRALSVADTRLGSQGLNSICKMRQLRQLFLDSTPFTDENLGQLLSYQNLQFLSLNHTLITTRSLAYLKNMTSLRSLYLLGIPFTDDELKELQHSLPLCDIVI